MQSHQIVEFLTGATVMGFIGHAVNSFPPQNNAYARWLIGNIQWIVGQRQQAQATRVGLTTGEYQVVTAADIGPKLKDIMQPPADPKP